MTGSGLSRYGIVPPTIVRDPVRDDDGWVVCPECGSAVGDSKGTQCIDHPDLLEDELADELDELLVHGWKCNRHTAKVVLPAHCHTVTDGWTAVEIELADGRPRKVPTPEPELPDRYLAETEGSR